MDSVEISLLTCQPHDEVYSLYGHTAIRYHEFTKGGIDAAFNYGVFNYDAPFFVVRFVFGLTDYELGAYPTQLFQKEYRHFGSMVTEQVLNLTNDEKLTLRMALVENLRPTNKVYRYNYFYNNCTTKARDIIEQHIRGKVQYTGREDYTPTYREMVHHMTRNHPWSRFGNDLLLGIQADSKTTMRQQEFLPDNLLYDFDHAQIYENGEYRPLVKERRIAVPAGVQMIHNGFPLTPLQIGEILLPDAVLATSYGTHQFAAALLQSAALDLSVARHQGQTYPLLADMCHHVYPVPHRQSIPIVRRRHLLVGIMFAATVNTTYFHV